MEFQLETAIANGAKIGAIVAQCGGREVFDGTKAKAYGWEEQPVGKDYDKYQSHRMSVWKRVSKDNIMTSKEFYSSLSNAGCLRDKKGLWKKRGFIEDDWTNTKMALEDAAKACRVPFHPSFIQDADRFMPVETLTPKPSKTMKVWERTPVTFHGD